MNICIVGYGKMGKMIYKAAEKAGHSVTAIVDPFVEDKLVTAKTVQETDKSQFDCVIDFSSPKGILENINYYLENGIDAVIGTTGWYDKLPEVIEKANASSSRLMWSGNYSLGVAVTLELIKRAGQLFNKLPSYDVSVHEVHHCHKLDAPSGTAIMMANALIGEMDRKEKYTTLPNAKADEIAVTSQRVGEVPGIHTVTFDTFEDTITINHSARSREGFANGSVSAASWLQGKEKGVYNMDDFMSDFFKEN